MTVTIDKVQWLPLCKINRSRKANAATTYMLHVTLHNKVILFTMTDSN